jgi:predicted transcriptional regulator
MKIIRTLVIVSVGAFFLPSPPESQQANIAPTPELMAAAANAASDVGSFCSRQPAVCSTASNLAGTLEAKARYSIKLLYEWANKDDAAALPPKVGAVQTDAVLKHASFQMASADVVPSQNTLKIEDIIPEWRNPLDVQRG